MPIKLADVVLSMLVFGECARRMALAGRLGGGIIRILDGGRDILDMTNVAKGTMKENQVVKMLQDKSGGVATK
jgi:hypothetical protein